MERNRPTLTDDQIIVEDFFAPNMATSIKNNLNPSYVAITGEGDGSGDGGDHGGDRYFPDTNNLKSAYSIVNGEGSDGDTDGSESDGDDKRF